MSDELDVTKLDDAQLDILARHGKDAADRRAARAEQVRRGMIERFEATAEAGNGGGAFDAAYGFGEGGDLTGTPEEIGAAVAKFLRKLNRRDVEEMKYGTSDFFIRLTIRPAGE